MLEKESESRTFKKLLERLNQAGFKKDFISRAIFPDWWDDSCSEDARLVQDIEIRLARFLQIPLATLQEPTASLEPPSYPTAQLRRVRDIDRDRLGPAIHSAVRVAEAVVRNLREVPRESSVPATDALAWRRAIDPSGRITLDKIISDLWKRGIPVVPLEVLPRPNFQGMVCIVSGRPVVLLGHRHDEPGRVAFLVAHEVGHVAVGDCTADQPVVDEEEEITDDTSIESRADQYASRLLIGSDTEPLVAAGNFKELAHEASEVERRTGADASAIIFAWARSTGDYVTATMAVRALYRHLGGRQLLRTFFDRHVNLSTASETDRALLRCVYGDPELDEAVG